MIIACAQMDVIAQPSILAPHHKRHLGVSLQFHEAEHDLHAGAFEIARPADIGFLVEARLEFHQRGDRLAGFGSIDQRADDRAVVRGAVQRLLDGDDIGIDGGLAQELHDDVERLVWVVDDDVLLADRREAVAAMVADAFGKTRIVGCEFQIVARHGDQFRHLVDRKQPVQHADPAGRHAEFQGDEIPQFRRYLIVEFDADHRTAPSPLQCGLEELHQIFRLFGDLDIAVADQPERPGALHLIAREELADELVDGFLDWNETDAFLAVGQPDESLQRHWKAQQRRHFLAISAMAKLQRNREAEIGNEGERMRRIDGERRQHRENLFVEVLFQPVPLVLRQGVRGDALNALRLEQNQKVGEALMLVFLQPPHLDQQLLELLLRGAAIGTLMAMPCRIWPARPATRTMKNSSRFAAEIDRKRMRSSRG